MKKLLLILFCLPMIGFGQNKDEENKKLTKMDLFTSKTGSIIKYIDYSLTDIKGNYSNGEARVRKIISGESIGYFFQISKTGKYSTKTASIEYSDLIEVIRAINTLKENSSSDIMSEGDYLENKFVTDDGFQIGYYVKNEKAIWYITLEKYGSDNNIFIRDLNEVESSFIEAKNKIDILKQ
jgi:hypothetical protein